MHCIARIIHYNNYCSACLLSKPTIAANRCMSTLSLRRFCISKRYNMCAYCQFDIMKLLILIHVCFSVCVCMCMVFIGISANAFLFVHFYAALLSFIPSACVVILFLFRLCESPSILVAAVAAAYTVFIIQQFASLVPYTVGVCQMWPPQLPYLRNIYAFWNACLCACNPFCVALQNWNK